MKRKLTAAILSLLMLVSSLSANAATQASYYLDSYTLCLMAEGDSEMSLSYTVMGVEFMDKVGALEIVVEERVGSNWYEYMVFDGEEEGLFSYGTLSESGTLYFYGFPGTTYRATMTVYAELDGGYDTGEITCSVEVCT